MSDHMKEAERLAQAYADAVLLGAGNDEALAALLAHIQRGAVPDMYDRIAEAHDASLDEDHTGCRAILKECMRLLAAAPAPDQFRDDAKMMAEPADPDPLHLSRILHELAGAASLCWEPRPTGVFDSQLAIQFVEQALAEIRSRMTSASAEVPMPQGYAERPTDYTGQIWIESQMRAYGAACRAAGEAAGYARVLEWAVSGWKAEVENRPLENKNRRSLDDVWRQVVRFAGGDPDALLGPSHDAALRGEVKP